MFGWEFPPHISGGLGTACYGLTQSLTAQGIDVLFVTPKAESGEPFPGVSLISASDVRLSQKMHAPRVEVTLSEERKVTGSLRSIAVKSELHPYFSVEHSEESFLLEHWNYQLYGEKSKEPPGPGTQKFEFSGGYGPKLLEEVKAYSMVARQIANDNSFDVIHAHDWMTFPAGIAAKESSGKPLIVHVHATEFDRTGANGNPEILRIEKEGMMRADQVIAVSHLTKRIIVNHYEISPDKVQVVHNGVQARQDKPIEDMPPIGKRVITFLGRVTHQKGPEYFVDAAALVHKKFPDVHFVMAGSGDLLPRMIRKVASLKLSSHFHFTGFLTSGKVDQLWSISEMYVMPSVSEPFGIAPLEAMMAGVPVIISNQSGVAEVVNHAIKVDFWDVPALASTMMSLLSYKSLSSTVRKNSQVEIKKINWDSAAKKVNAIYHETSTRT